MLVVNSDFLTNSTPLFSKILQEPSAFNRQEPLSTAFPAPCVITETLEGWIYLVLTKFKVLFAVFQDVEENPQSLLPLSTEVTRN